LSVRAHYTGALCYTQDALASALPLEPYPTSFVLDPTTARAFLGHRNGDVSVVDTRSDTLARTVHTVGEGFASGAMALDRHAGHVFVTNWAARGIGSVSMLDGADGTILRTIAVGVGPVAIAVDETTGRAFVVNLGPYDGNAGGYTHGSVSVLDTATGGLLNTVRLGSFGVYPASSRSMRWPDVSSWRTTATAR
jgi:DNA-binding beta-propeller fold protein YncE